MVIENDYRLLPQSATTTVLLMALVIALISGRVIPMFTANGTQTQKALPLPWLEKASLSGSVLVVLLSLFYQREDSMLASALIITGFCHMWRMLRWRIWVTFKAPMVWSLHLSYLSLAAGLILMGLSAFVSIFSFSQALHVVTVGAMGGMILAMMSRVSLGHTGRKIQSCNITTLSFCAIFIATLVRAAGSYFISDHLMILQISGFFWCLAMGLFLLRYIPVLSRARADGRPG